MSERLPIDVREMSDAQLWKVANSDKFPRHHALAAQFEIQRRDTEERRRIARRQEVIAWASVAAAALSALAAVALAVIAWLETG